MTKAQYLDVTERLLWTALQVVSAGAVVELFGLDPKWIVLIAAVMAAVKGLLATKFGNGTASTLPASLEPLPPTVSSDGTAAVVTTLPEGGTNVPGA